MRCSRCQTRFSLTIGRLWPQSSEKAYACLVTDTLSCPGERVGSLWVETTGAPSRHPPLLILPGHPAFPHEIMHDLADPLAEQTRVCYLEMHGYADEQEWALNDFVEDLRALRERLKAPGFHLLAHLHSAPLALEAAGRLGPQACLSLLLVCPDLGPVRLPDPLRKATNVDRPGAVTPSVEARLLSLLREEGPELLAGAHLRGLVSILAPRTSPALLVHGFGGGGGYLHGETWARAVLAGEGAASHRAPAAGEGNRLPAALGYRALSRLAVPMLVFSARDSSSRRREDALYLKNAIPAAALEELESGGIWSSWLSGERFLNQAARFLFGPAGARAAAQVRAGKPRTACGQPGAWVAAASLLIGWILAWLMSQTAFQPVFAPQVLPALIGGLLPIFWFLLPRRIPPGLQFRLGRWRWANILLGLLAGFLFGAGWVILLALTTGEGWLAAYLPAGWAAFQPRAEPSYPPSFLLSLPPGSPARPWLSLSLLPAMLLLGFLANLLALRRSPGRILLPALLFAALPPFWPDVLWKLPIGLAASFLFSRAFSLYPALLLVAGFEGAALALFPLLAEILPTDLGRFLLEPRATGPAAFILLAGLGLLCLMASPRQDVPPEQKYPPGLPAGGYRWHPAWGIAALILSTLGAAFLIAGFLQISP